MNLVLTSLVSPTSPPGRGLMKFIQHPKHKSRPVRHPGYDRMKLMHKLIALSPSPARAGEGLGEGSEFSVNGLPLMGRHFNGRTKSPLHSEVTQILKAAVLFLSPSPLRGCRRHLLHFGFMHKPLLTSPRGRGRRHLTNVSEL